MKKVEAYKCDFCPKASTNSGAMGRHEKYCKNNPNNKHKCFDFCTHLKRERCEGFTSFYCEKTDKPLFSYKAESRGMPTKGLERMPLKCDLFETMIYNEFEL